jgi:hypothetical protein
MILILLWICQKLKKQKKYMNDLIRKSRPDVTLKEAFPAGTDTILIKYITMT